MMPELDGGIRCQFKGCRVVPAMSASYLSASGGPLLRLNGCHLLDTLSDVSAT